MFPFLLAKERGTQVEEITKASWKGLWLWVAQSVKCLPSAQVMISGSWDQALHQAPCSAGSLLLLLPLPLLVLSLSLSLSLSHSQINKTFIKRERRKERKKKKERKKERNDIG